MTVRTAATAAVLAAVLLAPAACRRRERMSTQPTDEGPQGQAIASVVHMADPRTGSQLLRGFHTVEGNAWRWTTGKFAVVLKPPVNASRDGATLQVKLAIPENVMAKIGSTTLTAKVGDVSLAPETYKKAGDYTYSRDVPGTALTLDSVTCSFELSKYLPAGSLEPRELGVVVASIGFEPK